MQDYHKSLSLLWYMLYFTLFIKDVFQNSWRTTAPINSAPEIIFAGCNEENPNVPRRQILSNTILCNNLPQLISLNAANSFLPSFSGISLECALNSHSSQKCNLYCTQECTRNYSRSYVFFQKRGKKMEKKLVIKFVLLKQINFTNIFFFYMLHLLLSRKTPQPCMAGEKLYF